MCRTSVRVVSCLLLLSMVGVALGDLVGHWKFDEGSGGTVKDSSGKGHQGTILGTPVWASGPKGMGGAMDFDPACTGVDCGVFDPTNGKRVFSIAFWAFWDGTGTFQHFFTKSNGWGATTMMFQIELWGAHTDAGYTDRVGISYDPAGSVAFSVMPKNEWVHLTFVFDGTNLRLYLNGVDGTGPKPFSIGPDIAAPVLIGVDYNGGRVFHGLLDDFRIYDQALPAAQVKKIMESQSGQATDANPAENAADVPFDAALSWTPGEFAATHDVYLGTAFDDVNNATRANPMGVLVSQGQASAACEPGDLEYGRTYYWRVDEVNAPPDSTIFKGQVWNFATEPFGYPIAHVTATASSAQTGMGPQNTVNGSGLSADDRHSTKETDMWLTAGVLPNWIRFEFDNVYKLHELWVWNSNQVVEPFIGFGAKSVTVEYSVDGSTWTKLAGVPAFARANGAPAYAANTTVNFGGVSAKYVKLTIDGTWGGVAPQTGLSEVRFFYVPVQAREPQPAAAATDVDLDTSLSWRPGREATSHQVFFGAGEQAVADGTASAKTMTEHSYTPASLDFGTTYYWKVDEVGETGTYAGNLWSFTTREYAAIDDMESYNDNDNRIYDAWIDGWVNKTGSQVGYDVSPFAEKTVVHGGKQSMPLRYDNSASPFVSETERAFDTPQNWATSGADSLVLHFRGNAPAFAEMAAGNILMNAIGTDIWDTADQFRFAYKTLTGNGTVIARVESIFNSNAWAKGGVMIRQSIEPGSTHAFMPITPGGSGGGNGASFQRRPAANGVSANNDSTTVVAAPYWVKVERNGNSFTGSISPDGKTWTQLGTAQTITMTNPVLIGLALCSHSATVSTTAEFSNIAFTGNVTGAWQVAEIGAAQPAGNSAEGLYVTVKDSSGKTKTVTHPDASATGQASWQQWKIPLSEFTSAGVKMNAVKSMTIGVGNKAAPAKGGAGTLFIDDVGYGRPVQ